MCCVAIACDSSHLCYVVRPCKINVVIPHSSSYICCASDFGAWLFSCSRFPWLFRDMCRHSLWLFRNMCPHSPRSFRIMCFVVTALSCPATLVVSPHPLVVQKYASSQSLAVQKPMVVPKDVLCRHSLWLFRSMCRHSPRLFRNMCHYSLWLFRNVCCVVTAPGCSETCVVTAPGCSETYVVSSQRLVVQKHVSLQPLVVQKHVLCHHSPWLFRNKISVSAQTLVVQKHVLWRCSETCVSLQHLVSHNLWLFRRRCCVGTGPGCSETYVVSSQRLVRWEKYTYKALATTTRRWLCCGRVHLYLSATRISLALLSGQCKWYIIRFSSAQFSNTSSQNRY